MKLLIALIILLNPTTILYAQETKKDQTCQSKIIALDSKYISTIANKIHQQWSWPNNTDKHLETIITVKIHADGTLTIAKFEKLSGNKLFDKTAIRTIEKASPVEPPLCETEIGIRFQP